MSNDNYTYLLAEVILAPFIKTELNEKDWFYEYAFYYDKVVHGNGIESSYNDDKKNYTKAKKELVKLFSVDSRWNHLDDIMRTIEVFYPIECLVICLNKDEKGIEWFYLNYIFKLSNDFITFRDGDIAIKYWTKDNNDLFRDGDIAINCCENKTNPFRDFGEFEKIKLWNDITRTTSIDIFIAAALINYNVDIDRISNVPNLISLADMPLRKILERGVAETHIHAKAGISYQTVWDKKVNLFIESRDENAEGLMYCAAFRAFSAIFLEERKNESFECFLERRFCSNTIKRYFVENDMSLCFDERSVAKCPEDMNVSDSIYEINKLLMNDNRKDTPLLSSYYKEYVCKDISPDIVLYYKIFNYLNEKYDYVLCRHLFRYIRIKNEFFRNKKQKTSIKGLDYFQEFYDNATDVIKTSEEYYYAIFEEQYRTGHVNLLEIKISPYSISSISDTRTAINELKGKTIKQIYMVLHAYERYIKKYYPKENDDSRPRLGIVYHFIKKDDVDNFSGKNCVFMDNRYYHRQDYNSMRQGAIIFIDALSELFKEYPVFTKYVVGIDAASVENATEPWVYAPAFRHARRNENTIIYWNERNTKVQNLGFTYHVGEDFRHIVSGLRHIDEVLENYNYHTGDRLGHAIALGIDIDLWANKCEMVSIPIMEYMENLLWIWKYSENDCLIDSANNIEYKIMDIASRIYYESILGINVYTLWRVYKRKFDNYSTNCHSIDKTSCLLADKNIVFWDEDKLLTTHFCPSYYERFKKPIVVSTKENVHLYKQLQEMLVRKVEKMGVYIETNPSSNTAISDIAGIFSHPIIRLNNRGLDIPDKKDSCVLATINSDDPIVFSTNVENEMAYIYYALLNKGCKREEALEWIDKIRKHGIDSSFIKDKSDDFNKDYAEIKNIYNSL